MLNDNRVSIVDEEERRSGTGISQQSLEFRAKVLRFQYIYKHLLIRNNAHKKSPPLKLFGARNWECAYTIARVKIPGFRDGSKENYECLRLINNSLPFPHNVHWSNLKMERRAAESDIVRYAPIGTLEERLVMKLIRTLEEIGDLVFLGAETRIPARKLNRLVRKRLNLRGNIPIARLVKAILEAKGWKYRASTIPYWIVGNISSRVD